MKKLFPIIIVIGAVLLAAAIIQKQIFSPSNPKAVSNENPIAFPTSDSTLTKGKTYKIIWQKGEGMTDVFLIESALESEGVSASIADRVYNIPNNGNYSYEVPKNIPDGEYKLQIGPHTSDYFLIQK